MIAIIIFFIVLCISAICLPIIFACIESRQYTKYINSIKPGDVFVNELFVFETPNDPFDEKYDRSVDGYYDESFFTTILDIKENKHGEIWVKYCFTDYAKRYKNPKTFTKKLSDYLKNRHRLDE